MSLFEDSVIETTAQDELGRKEIVAQIVNAIKAKVITTHGPITIGVYGAWGEGKTSTMRMVENELKLSKISCLWFNPWSFSGEGRMVKEFFSQLAKFTYPEKPQIGKILASYGNSFLRIENAQSSPSIAQYQAGISNCIPFAGNDFFEIKTVISKRLVNDDQHLVVFIDDIDRLDTSEVHTMFRLIRQVVDFKNVIYILGLDPDVISLQLGKFYGKNEQTRGRDYLEKIINIPIVLPAVQDSILEDIIRKEVSQVWSDNKLPLDMNAVDFVANKLLPVLRTKRAIDRFANQLSFVVPTIGVETEFVDLCLVELLKYLNEKGWYEIYNQKSGLLRENVLYVDVEDKVKREKMVFEDAETQVLKHYPIPWHAYVKSILEQYLFTDDNVINSNKLSKRINNPQYFKQYFIVGVPAETIPRSEALEFSNCLDQNKDRAIKWINEKLKSFSSSEVERSVCLALDILNNKPPSTVAAELIKVCSKSDLAQGYGFHTIGNPSRIDGTIYAQIIPWYMVDVSENGRRIPDRKTETDVLSEVFKEAPLNFCMSLFTGIYSKDSVRPSDEKGVFDVIKNRLQAEGDRAIFQYSYPIKQAFIREWMETDYDGYYEYWNELLKKEDFDLGEVIKNWLEAVSPQEQLSEIGTIAELMEPVAGLVYENLLRTAYKDNILLERFVSNSGLFEYTLSGFPIFKNIEEIMRNIEICERLIEGKEKQKVKIAILQTTLPLTDINAVNSMMNTAVSEYVQREGHNTFVEEHKDTPNIRIVIKNINDLDFKPYEDQHL